MYMYIYREEKLSFDELQAVADFIRKSTSIVPEFGIICGSGLGGLAEHLESKTIIPYKDIPNFPQCKGVHTCLMHCVM